MDAVLDLRPIAPAAIVAVTGLVVLLAQAFSPKGKASPSSALSLAGLAAARRVARGLVVVVRGRCADPRRVAAVSDHGDSRACRR